MLFRQIDSVKIGVDGDKLEERRQERNTGVLHFVQDDGDYYHYRLDEVALEI
jgi:hypothetical protein